jgi:2,5-diketo-D-gluconate reductase A
LRGTLHCGNRIRRRHDKQTTSEQSQNLPEFEQRGVPEQLQCLPEPSSIPPESSGTTPESSGPFLEPLPLKVPEPRARFHSLPLTLTPSLSTPPYPITSSPRTLVLHPTGTHLQSRAECTRNVEFALRQGVRHLDTAEVYGNHLYIAEGIRRSCVPRSSIFIADKCNPGGCFGQDAKTYEETIEACKSSLEALDTDYIDLYLLHHGGAKFERLNQYRALLNCQELGLIKHVGVSNYSIKHLLEIENANLPLPRVNQIELHPLCTQTDLVAFCRKRSIVIVAYSSLAPCSLGLQPKLAVSLRKGAVNPTNAHVSIIANFASKYNVSQSQLLLKWALQKGFGIIPKSDKREGIVENTKLFHFDIEGADMAALDGLNRNMSLAWPGTNPLDWE